MRFQTYIRKRIENGEAQVIPFGPDDFREAGIGYAPIAGMPLLEAHQFVNRRNAEQERPRYLYCLA